MTPWPLRTVPRGGALAGLLCLLGAGALGGTGFVAGRLWARHEAGPPPVIEREAYLRPVWLKEPRPVLAESFGRLLEVQGIVEEAGLEDGSKGPILLHVETVGDRKVSPAFLIRISYPREMRWETYPWGGQRVVLRGYESGVLAVDIPADSNGADHRTSELSYFPEFRIQKLISSTASDSSPR